MQKAKSELQSHFHTSDKGQRHHDAGSEVSSLFTTASETSIHDKDLEKQAGLNSPAIVDPIDIEGSKYDRSGLKYANVLTKNPAKSNRVAQEDEESHIGMYPPPPRPDKIQHEEKMPKNNQQTQQKSYSEPCISLDKDAAVPTNQNSLGHADIRPVSSSERETDGECPVSHKPSTHLEKSSSDFANLSMCPRKPMD